MCFWGAALVLGPNYNVPMLPDRAKTAWEALDHARDLAKSSSPVERALIEALAKRYKGPEPLGPEAMAPYSAAYADAMRGVAKQFPDDDDVQVLFAESMMDVAPWKLWSLDGTPAPGTEEIISTLERVLARSKDHPGANHYYIHTMEASTHPDKALESAERLPALMPGAGHLVHMPAHIFQRVGRYADASTANSKAIEADLAYMSATKPPGYYPMYLGHNYGFLSFSASMEGRRADSLAASRQAAKALPPGMVDMMPGMDFFVAEPILAMVRFGRWDELLAEPKPDPKYTVLTGFWLHGHGLALAAKGKFVEAAADLDALDALAAHAPDDLRAGNNQARDVLTLAARILEARLATLQKKKDALALWADATKKADQLAYSEPEDWFYPVRHFEGAALLSAGRAKQAEAVYREDLRRHPHNGWALFGLSQALAKQKKTSEAAKAKAEYDAAWQKADFPLTTTAF
jgi:tetratricopeptide (TPR) repeat protein